MPLSRSRDYLSIGEVLDSLKKDFPDVSISKIRFLESEGLIAPERTGSGYRKFFDKDVNRLRAILAMQRDQFLPLKVIRERLESGIDGGYVDISTAPAKPRTASGAPTNGTGTGAGEAMTGVQMSRQELLAASKLSDQQLQGLEDFGLVTAGEGGYDENALVVCRAARRFFEFGAEARHLRMFKQAADREVAFFEQIVSPVSRRRDPGARAEATASLSEMANLARQIREAALRASLREVL